MARRSAFSLFTEALQWSLLPVRDLVFGSLQPRQICSLANPSLDQVPRYFFSRSGSWIWNNDTLGAIWSRLHRKTWWFTERCAPTPNQKCTALSVNLNMPEDSTAQQITKFFPIYLIDISLVHIRRSGQYTSGQFLFQCHSQLQLAIGIGGTISSVDASTAFSFLADMPVEPM